jgi:hypothetical protein
MRSTIALREVRPDPPERGRLRFRLFNRLRRPKNLGPLQVQNLYDGSLIVVTTIYPILYLDIDGVLLRRRHTGMFDAYEIAPGCLDFLEWATARFQCRWLSSRCRAGWPDGTRRAFHPCRCSIG